ncbi:MAG: hypothetical protein EOM54_12655 [Clostridia bacterium]|nr:hypothetical protein [Clostridia bacterium]
MEKLAKTIRVLTVPPFMALLALTVLFMKVPHIYGQNANYMLAVLFLTVFPLLAYPLQPIIPGFRNKGRTGQRNLAMVFAVMGYIGGCVSALIMHATRSVIIIYVVYLISGVLIAVCDKVFRFKASGHTCGIAGPFAILVSMGQTCGYFGIPVLIAAWWASLRTKRHTFGQLLGGSFVPLVSLAIVLLAAGGAF